MSAALHINRKGRDWRPIIYNSLVVVRMGGRTAVRPYNPVLVGWVDAQQCVLTILFWLDGWTHSSASLQSCFGWMGGRTAVCPYDPVLVGWVDAQQCVLTILFWLDGWTHSSASLQSYHPTILFLLNWWTHSSASLPFHDFTIQQFPPSSSYHPDEFGR